MKISSLGKSNVPQGKNSELLQPTIGYESFPSVLNPENLIIGHFGEVIDNKPGSGTGILTQD